MKKKKSLCRYKEIIFRNLMKSIPSSTYATHGIYKHPAKFIPHVIRYVLRKYTRKEDWVFDPFAGSGSLAIEASFLNRNVILWDLNPMLDLFVRASTFRDEIDQDELQIDWNYDKFFIPRWKNLEYWHPKEFIKALSKLWGYYHSVLENKKIGALIAIPLLKVTKYFSYADLGISKLYKSKKAKERIRNLLRMNWKTKLRELYENYLEELLIKIREYQSLNPKEIEIQVFSGINSIERELNAEPDVLFTSPPYLHAQEYIRSFKLELFWLGYSEEFIRDLSRKEIPYNVVPEVRIKSEIYKKIRRVIVNLNHKRLLRIYDNYFASLAYFFQKNADKIKNYICIFVGESTIRTLKIPIFAILKEILESMGWKCHEMIRDNIFRHRLFKTKRNPATKLPNRRMRHEYLLVMKKKK
ncbi:MAG: DNA methyltransferase [Candidatus Njordarchaeales archaeon]